MSQSPRILGYGEDSLTLWALHHLDTAGLKPLGDQTSPKDCLAIYRPSFGRSGKGKAEFGEFDFIIITPTTVYLGESKWENSGEVADGTLVVRDGQVERHEVFRWLLEAWYRERPSDWTDLSHKVGEEFQFRLSDRAFAPDGSTLAATLTSVLSRIAERLKRKPEIVNLLRHIKGEETPPVIETNPGFQLLNVLYPGLGKGTLVEL